MRTLVACALSLGIAGVAHAQPGQTPAPAPGPYAPPPQQPYPYPPPQPQPQPQPYPYPYPYPQQQLQLTQEELTQEEWQLLQDGEVSDGQHIGGGLASVFLGFGSGQAIQGRWSDAGWVFTLGEVGSVVAIIAGAATCEPYGCDDNDDQAATLIIGGALSFMVFRVWEVVDAFSGPASHNRKVRNLRMRMGYPYQGPFYSPFVTPTADGDGAVTGLTIRF